LLEMLASKKGRAMAIGIAFSEMLACNSAEAARSLPAPTG